MRPRAGVNHCHFVLVRELIQSTGSAQSTPFFKARVPGTVLKARGRKNFRAEHKAKLPARKIASGVP